MYRSNRAFRERRGKKIDSSNGEDSTKASNYIHTSRCMASEGHQQAAKSVSKT
jgi:hypothetical protein